MAAAETVDVIYKLAEIGIVIAGAVSILLKMGQIMGAFEAQKEDIADMKTATKILTEVVTQLAVQKVEMANTQKQITTLFDWYDELRRGVGVITLPPPKDR